MKNWVLFVLACAFSSNGLTQTYPENTKYIVTTVATEYDHGDSVKQVITKDYYDSAWSKISSSGSWLPGINRGARSEVTVNTKNKKVTTYFDSKGDTTDQFIYLYDDVGNQIFYFQIRNGDTLNAQKRDYDSNNNNTKLYNKSDGHYKLFMRFEYDSNNVCIHKVQYNINTGGVVSQDKHDIDPKTKVDKWYQATGSGDYVLRMITTPLSDSVSKSLFFENSTGYNYGIKLVREERGYSITERFSTGSIKRLEIYDRKGRKSATVYVSYIAI